MREPPFSFPPIEREGFGNIPVYAGRGPIEPIPDDADQVQITTSEESVYIIDIPDGIGKFEVETKCGRMRGTIRITETEDGRGIDWVALCGPRESSESQDDGPWN